MHFMSVIFLSYLRASSVCVLHPTCANSVQFMGLHVLLSLLMLITFIRIPSVYEAVTPHLNTVWRFSLEFFLHLTIHFRCLLRTFLSLPSPHRLPKHNQRCIAILIPKILLFSVYPSAMFGRLYRTTKHVCATFSLITDVLILPYLPLLLVTHLLFSYFLHLGGSSFRCYN